MNELQVTSPTITAANARLKIEDIRVKERLRERLNEENVQRLMQSFLSVGLQIHPITVDEHHVLISGEHRLEAARRLTARGEEGWDTLDAHVVSGATEQDHRWIELEENQARAEMSPVEIQKAWETYGEPLFKAKAKERKETLGVAAMLESRGLDSSTIVTGNTGNNASEAPVSLVTAARQSTGRDLDWLNKVHDVRTLAENEKAPTVLREAAQRGLQRLSKPNAPVEPVWKALEKLKAQYRASEDTTNAEEARVAALEKQLDQSVKEVTLIEDRLGKGLAAQLGEAARVAPLGTEMLRAIRVSLTKSLAEILVAECNLTNDPNATLNVVGGEATSLLAKHTAGLLQSATQGVRHE